MFGLPDLPSRPELYETSALTYAVQLCRPACVKALLDCDSVSRGLLGLKDWWGHTATEYAMAMLTRWVGVACCCVSLHKCFALITEWPVAMLAQ